MSFDIINPATGEKTNSFEAMSSAEAQEILAQCARAQQAWGRTPLAERSERMRAVARLLQSRKKEYARLMALEMGKIHSQAIAEIEKCALVCDYYAEHAEIFLAAEDVVTGAEHSFISYQPLGVVLAVMPWNYPLWQVFRFAAPALMAGNGAVLKHAPNVFGCSLAIENVFQEAGFPDDLFRSLIIDIPLTTELIHHPLIAAITVTASVNTGRAVASEAGKALKKCVLELGGSDPFIVLGDAEIEKAVEVGVTSRFQNSGQSCIAAKRFIVVDQVYEEFETRFVDAVRVLKMGNPTDDGVSIGPLARAGLRDDLHEQVLRSLEAGARLLTGGRVPEVPGAFYPATVLADVRKGMPAWDEELFGPVAVLIRVQNEQEALEVANDTDFGLGGSVWTQDLARGERIAREEIRSGAAFVNEMSMSDPRMPFGGIRNSGYGRELSVYGIREFTNVHTVWVNKLA